MRKAPSTWGTGTVPESGSTCWREERAPRGSDLVRLSLCCAPHTSLHAVAAAVTRLKGWDVPWLLSSRSLRQAVPGPDATAVYFPADAVSELREPVLDLVADLQPFLAGSVPALTLRIGRGAALAQNPPDGSSYGEHRCSILAHAVLANLSEPHPLIVERTLTAFRLAQVDPQRPYRALSASWEWDRRRVSAA